jgi:hypothetical protein
VAILQLLDNVTDHAFTSDDSNFIPCGNAMLTGT